LSPPLQNLLISLGACIFFGYSALSCVIFHRRTRERAAQYKDRPLETLVRSPQYNWALWLSGVIGVGGFAVSSWQFVLNAIALLHAR
jgi:hypothetical protein